MRSVVSVLCLLPTSLWAADIPSQSRISDVTVYPQGATITRTVPFQVSQGRHTLILTDLPPETPLERVRVTLEGARMSSVSLRRDDLPNIEPPKSPAQSELDDRIDTLEAELRALSNARALIQTEISSAEARVRFLEQLGEGDGVAALGVQALRDLTGLVGEETLVALRNRQDAQMRSDEMGREISALKEALAAAQEDLAALTPQIPDERAMLAIRLEAEAETSGRAFVTYTIAQASWTPIYDVRLDRAAQTVTLERGAFIAQSSGENWDNVDLTLSTVRPSEQTAPGELWPWLRQIYDPSAVVVSPVPMAEAMAGFDAAIGTPLTEESRITRAAADFDGLAVRYAYPEPVTVANSADRVRLALGDISFTAEITARAVPLSDETAFLMARITNDAEELILPSSEAMFYRDGRFIGQSSIELIPAGGAADLAFGPIDGVQVSRIVVDRNEGDRGVITRSNAITEEVILRVENLTGESWPLRLLDQVPYSEQEDLKITWESSVPVTEQDVDDKRGVLAWSFELLPGATQEVRLEHALQWPDDKVLQ